MERTTRGKDDKMKNAKVCRMQLQLHGFTLRKVMSAAAALARRERVRAEMRESVESSHLRGPSCSSTFVFMCDPIL